MSFLWHLFKTSIRASISIRGAFLFESALMIGNNLIFFSIWWVFFREFQDIKGWTMEDMIALMAIGTGSYGLMLIFFGGVKQLSRLIIQGDLDSFMTQPKNLLLHLIGSRSLSKGWGHLMTTTLLIIFGKLYSPSTLLLILVSILSGALTFTSIGVIAHSLAFWLGPIESVSRKYCDSLFLFVLYPANIYSGVLQLIMYTVIPAGIIGTIPVELIREFTFPKLIILVGSSIFFFGLAFFVFSQGLKKYESGSQFGMRL